MPTRGYASGLALEVMQAVVAPQFPPTPIKRVILMDSRVVKFPDDLNDIEGAAHNLEQPDYVGQLLMAVSVGSTVSSLTAPDLDSTGNNFVTLDADDSFAVLIGIQASPTTRRWRAIALDDASLAGG